MSAQRDYYEVLGIAKDAEQKTIKDAFRSLALKYHPDRNKEPGAEERFREIAEAYAVLSDPKKRADYDARGFAAVAGFSREDLFGGIAPRKCETCGGTGRITHSRREEKGYVLIQQISSCLACHGRGSINERSCPECHGSGEAEQEETLTVKIPVGIEEGMALSIPGKGMPSPVAGGAAGELFVVVRSRRDPRFERAGADLLRTVTLPLTDAVLGTTVEVPTLDGPASVTVPSGTQPDTVLRLKGKGLPEFGSNRHGDLYLRVRLQVPEHLSREERELYERLRAIGGGAH